MAQRNRDEEGRTMIDDDVRKIIERKGYDTSCYEALEMARDLLAVRHELDEVQRDLLDTRTKLREQLRESSFVYSRRRY